MLRILAPCATLTACAVAACAYNLVAAPAWGLRTLSLNLAPLQLLAPVIGLLLVFRTNGSYARFTEGRLLWGAAVRHTRDLGRLAATHLAPSRTRQQLLAYLEVWPWLLKAHLRSGRTRADPADPTAYRDDPSLEVGAALPPALAAHLLAAPNRPFVALLALSQLLASLQARTAASARCQPPAGRPLPAPSPAVPSSPARLALSPRFRPSRPPQDSPLFIPARARHAQHTEGLPPHRL